MVHICDSALQSWEAFSEDPEYGGAIRDRGMKVPGVQTMESLRFPWVIFKPRRFTTADRKLHPWRENYRSFYKVCLEILSKANRSMPIPRTIHAWIRHRYHIVL